MVTVISRFRVRNGLEAEVRGAFLNRPRLVEDNPGFCGLDVLVEAKDPSVFLLIARWRDEESFQIWHSSDAHHQSHQFMPRGLKLDAAFTSLTVGHGLPRPDGAHNLNDALERETVAISEWLMKSGLLIALLLSPDGTIRVRNSAASAIFPLRAASCPTIWEYLDASDTENLRRNLAAPTQENQPCLRLIVEHREPLAVNYELLRCNGAILFLASEVPSL